MSEHHLSEHHIVPPKTYIKVLSGLMVLMALTVFAAQIHIGPKDQHIYNLLMALFIAACKMSLIVAFFMHVKYSSKLTRIFASVGFCWLAIFFVLLFCDYMGRWLGTTAITINPYGG